MNQSYYRECVRYHAIRRVQHIGVSPLASKFSNFNYSPTFEDFNVLCHENKKYLLELKESLIIMRDRTSMTQNISFPSLIFEWVLFTLFTALCGLCDQVFS